MYVNDIEGILLGSNLQMKLFADDAKLYSSFVYLSGDLQLVCNRLLAWAKEWQLQIAFEKCCVTCVQRISSSDNALKCNTVYTIGDHVLRNSNETRDLGVIIDNKLNFSTHISAISHKVHVRASLILRSFTTRDFVFLTKAFVIYVRPILEYCTPVWSPYTVCNINKLERCQR